MHLKLCFGYLPDDGNLLMLFENFWDPTDSWDKFLQFNIILFNEAPRNITRATLSPTAPKPFNVSRETTNDMVSGAVLGSAGPPGVEVEM